MTYSCSCCYFNAVKLFLLCMCGDIFIVLMCCSLCLYFNQSYIQINVLQIFFIREIFLRTFWDLCNEPRNFLCFIVPGMFLMKWRFQIIDRLLDLPYRSQCFAPLEGRQMKEKGNRSISICLVFLQPVLLCGVYFSFSVCGSFLCLLW